MMAPKLRFRAVWKRKRPAPSLLVFPARSDAAREIFTGPSTTTGTRSNDGEGDDFFFLPSRVFQVYDCYFTNVLTQRSCLGFLLNADSQCFTRNDARTEVRTDDRSTKAMARRAFTVSWNVAIEVFVHSRSVVIFLPGAPVTSFLSQQISTVIRSPRFQQDETSWALSSIAVVTEAIKRTARTSLPHLGSATTLFPAIWTKTARSIEDLFSQWKRPRRASSDQRTDEEDTSETCNNNHVGGRALTNA